MNRFDAWLERQSPRTLWGLVVGLYAVVIVLIVHFFRRAT